MLAGALGFAAFIVLIFAGLMVGFRAAMGFVTGWRRSGPPRAAAAGARRPPEDRPA